MPTALVTGIGGQDGSYLAEFLRSKGYRVVGLTRDPARVRSLPYAAAFAGVELQQAPPGLPGMTEVLRRAVPNEVYHLAAPSRVSSSWADPAATQREILGTTAVLLEALQAAAPAARCFVAGSCEMFGPSSGPQNETAPRKPVSPYGEAKRAAYDLVKTYRTMAGMHVSTGILFNHESPRRDPSFVSRKIACGAANIAAGRQRELRLGDVSVRRDWGFAGDYVRAMWLMLQQEEASDLVIGTGVAHSVQDFCAAAFAAVGLDWRSHVVPDDAALKRPTDAPLRLADPARARRRLGWTPEVDFFGLVRMMVDAEMADGSRQA